MSSAGNIKEWTDRQPRNPYYITRGGLDWKLARRIWWGIFSRLFVEWYSVNLKFTGSDTTVSDAAGMSTQKLEFKGCHLDAKKWAESYTVACFHELRRSTRLTATASPTSAYTNLQEPPNRGLMFSGTVTQLSPQDNRMDREVCSYTVLKVCCACHMAKS